MAFWKWFAKRSRAEETTVGLQQPPNRSRGSDKAKPPSSTELEFVDDKPGKPVGAQGGFDPYNSGAFDRRGNWDKMRRK